MILFYNTTSQRMAQSPPSFLSSKTWHEDTVEILFLDAFTRILDFDSNLLKLIIECQRYGTFPSIESTAFLQRFSMTHSKSEAFIRTMTSWSGNWHMIWT